MSTARMFNPNMFLQTSDIRLYCEPTSFLWATLIWFFIYFIPPSFLRQGGTDCGKMLINGCVCSFVRENCNPTDSGIQATDSLLNILKPQIPLPLFQKARTDKHLFKDAHFTCTQTHKSLCGSCGNTWNINTSLRGFKNFGTHSLLDTLASRNRQQQRTSGALFRPNDRGEWHFGRIQGCCTYAKWRSNRRKWQKEERGGEVITVQPKQMFLCRAGGINSTFFSFSLLLSPALQNKL